MGQLPSVSTRQTDRQTLMARQAGGLSGDHSPSEEGGCGSSVSGQLVLIYVLQESLSLQIAFAEL